MVSVNPNPTPTLSETLERLRSSGCLPAAVQWLRRDTDAIDAQLSRTVIAEIPAFSASSNPEVLADLARHGPQHTAELLRLLEDGGRGDFTFVAEHANRCAAQRFPLEATLHAYRCVQKVLSGRLRDAILQADPPAGDAPYLVAAAADLAMEYTDAICSLFTDTYLTQTRLLAEISGDERAELLTLLLEGYDESDGRVASILRSAGYLDRRQSFCVALAQSVEPAEMLNHARARRLADSIDKMMQGSSIRRLIDIRNNRVVVVFSATRRASGWTAPSSALAGRIAPELKLLGNAVVTGISNDVPSTSRIPTAYREALLALEFASVTQRVVQISEVPIQRLLLHLAGEEFHRVLPAWCDRFYQLDDKQQGAMVATLRAYASADMNVLKAAERLSLHPNTIYARLQKLLDVTGQDAKNFHALSELLIVADCRNQTNGGYSAAKR